MRSIRTMLLLALAAMAAAALAAPGFAAASEWTKEGKPLGQAIEPVFTDGGLPLEAESSPVSLEGKIKFSSSTWGSEECTLSAKATLGTNGVGQISEAALSLPSCKTAGTLAACTVTSATAGSLPWPLTATSESIVVGTNVTFKFEGKFCPVTEETLSGGFYATPDNTKAMNSLTLSGAVNTSLQAGKTKNVTGSLSVSPGGRYGVGQVAAVNLTGAHLSFSSGMIGSVECSFSGKIALRPGSGGTVQSIEWGKCSTGGGLNTCTVSSVTSKNLPWSLLDEGTRIGISNVSFKINFEGAFCPYSFFEAEGTIYATPDKTSAISSVTLAGTLTTHTGGSEFKGSWTGSSSWSPAGVYGL